MPDTLSELFVLFREGRFAGMSLNMEDANALAEHTVKGAEIVRYVPVSALDAVLAEHEHSKTELASLRRLTNNLEARVRAAMAGGKRHD